MNSNVHENCLQLTQEEKDQFLSLIEKTPTCWLWKGKITKDGYGQARIKNLIIAAYRASFVIFNFTKVEELETLKGKCVCHACGIRACVNPEHLYLGTHADNARDRLRHGHPPEYFEKFLTPEQIKEIAATYPYTTRRALAKKYNIHPRVIFNLANTYKMFKLKFVKKNPSKIADENKADIINLFKTTSIPDIAKLYNIPKREIYRLIFCKEF